jgi:heme exporter protein D
VSGGYIHGGWGFVWAAYGLTFTFLLLYSVSLIVRYRSERRRFGGGSGGADNP